MAGQDFREKKAALVGYEGMPWPERCSILDMSDGGYLVVSTAFSDKPYPCPFDFKPDVSGRGKFLIFTLASVSRDGIIALQVSTTEKTSAAELPDDEELDAMVRTLRDTGLPPATFGQAALNWERITNSLLLLGFVQHGYAYRLVRTPVTMETEAAIRISERFRTLSKTKGSLANGLSRHNISIRNPISRLSTDLPWAIDILRDRPWISEKLLERWPDERMTGKGITAEAMAGIFDLFRKSPEADSISTASVAWCDKFFALHAAEAPDAMTLELISALPRSWWPKDVEDYIALRTLAPSLIPLCDYDPVEAVDLLRPSKGRFADYVVELSKGLLPLWAGDFPDAPFPGSEYYAKRRRIIFRRVAWYLNDCRDMLHSIDEMLVSPFRGNPGNQLKLTVARQIVTRGGGMGRYLEASKGWHENPQIRDILAARIETLQLTDTWTTSEWPACVAPFMHEGVEVVEICNAGDLAIEGKSLKHCVGGKNYVEKCMRGTTRIVSFRKGDAILSTAEFSLHSGNVLRVQQHRGEGNGMPPAPSLSAMEAWKAAISNGILVTFPIRNIPMPAVPRIPVRDIASTLEGYGPSAWRPVIRRDLAAMSWEEFGQQVREMHLAAYPEAPEPDQFPGV